MTEPMVELCAEPYRAVRIVATYPATPWACPESMSVEWNDRLPSTLDISSAVAALAAVPTRARPDGR